ncbi:MAG: flagellar biosynthesis protein FlhB [Clostridiales bacterium]|nr:flagellar biosynthesis protein FlhB [Clostridiales bacterium]
MSPQQTGEKTEKATPKKKRDAREKGQIFKSSELISSMSLIVMLATFSIFGTGIINNLMDLLRSMFSINNIPSSITRLSVGTAFIDALRYFFIIMAPILIAAFVSALVFNLLQVGFLFSPKAMAPKLEKISMAAGFKRLFSVRTIVELVKSILKISIICIVAYNEYQTQIVKMPMLMNENFLLSAQHFVKIILTVAFKIAIALAIFTPLDFLYQWWKHAKDLKMTKQEIKDEYKLSEGDPQIKGKIKQKQREMSNMRMMQAVEDADVIITNPTHYAIGLKYKEEDNDAPIVIAKGKDYLAQKIKAKAKELEIEMVENRPLAQSLYIYCDVGDEVPEDLYQAVAEILAYVYKLKQNWRGGR